MSMNYQRHWSECNNKKTAKDAFESLNKKLQCMHEAS